MNLYKKLIIINQEIIFSLHKGQIYFSYAHDLIHSTWKRCLHLSSITYLSILSLNSPKQIEHSTYSASVDLLYFRLFFSIKVLTLFIVISYYLSASPNSFFFINKAQKKI